MVRYYIQNIGMSQNNILDINPNTCNNISRNNIKKKYIYF